jgi:pyridoxamine 5'-phosphate oxidase
MRHENEFLPEPLPADPFGLFNDWFTAARQRGLQPNPNAMVLATIDANDNPAARIVLCKYVVSQPGYLVFFTNYLSHKGRQLDRHPRAAVVFHWDGLQRQVRMTGPTLKSPPAESDAYFVSRPLPNRIGTWASRQSEPLASRARLAEQVDETMTRFAIEPNSTEGNVPRPPNWGGYRLWPETIELWVEGPGRIHDRAIWTRTVDSESEFTMSCGSWSSTRLNP